MSINYVQRLMTEQEGEIIDWQDLQLKESQILATCKNKSYNVWFLGISCTPLSQHAIQILAGYKWSQLKILRLQQNWKKGMQISVQDGPFQTLVARYWNELGGKRGDDAPFKGQMGQLTYPVYPDGNLIKVITHINAAKWAEISRMSLDNNKLTYQELLILILADLRELACLQIYNNGLDRSEMKKYGYLMKFKYWKLRIIADQIYS